VSKQYGMLIDMKRCIGCHACSIACKVENGTPLGVDWHRVMTIGGDHLDTPSGVYPHLSMAYLPVPCMHCQNAPCQQVCPAAAISRRADGIVLIDSQKCIGCQYCVWACPYGVPQYNQASGTVEKCTFCAQRVDQGQQPFCVDACVYGARVFGDLNDPNSEVVRAIAERHGEPAMPEQGTKPSVYYSPV
jgi:molybdopterin-containing oxidoreductase family iron-sulfur binding subunit